MTACPCTGSAECLHAAGCHCSHSWVVSPVRPEALVPSQALQKARGPLSLKQVFRGASLMHREHGFGLQSVCLLTREASPQSCGIPTSPVSKTQPVPLRTIVFSKVRNAAASSQGGTLQGLSAPSTHFFPHKSLQTCLTHSFSLSHTVKGSKFSPRINLSRDRNTVTMEGLFAFVEGTERAVCKTQAALLCPRK